MFKSSELGDELQALRGEMSRLLDMPANDVFDAAKSRTEALTEQIKAALGELAETFEQEELPRDALPRPKAIPPFVRPRGEETALLDI